MTLVQVHRRALVIVAVTVTFIFVLLRSLPSNPDYSDTPIHHVDASQSMLHGEVIMPTLGNETQKYDTLGQCSGFALFRAELGRAAWKLFHTIMARFPDKPSKDESTALEAYIHLFARLYPCGECAGHFRQILDRYPPQTSSRSSAAAWACHVHNVVNKSLKKPDFDCSKIGDFYKCGCADEDEGSTKGGEGGTVRNSGDAVQKTTTAPTDGERKVRMKLEKEG
ncbi:hypothetical protein GP486_006544 [Trichoglossum hirsutum]|uniref:Sulfhydryl oxidase n=1 Tax=Trichoglossum hirsutum TaxID=265104 RepID=A0A9P8L7S7_9PEZI|nr:hypothetical protein GP486_006544 [Trichoglossum hirsutum]